MKFATVVERDRMLHKLGEVLPCYMDSCNHCTFYEMRFCPVDIISDMGVEL